MRGTLTGPNPAIYEGSHVTVSPQESISHVGEIRPNYESHDAYFDCCREKSLPQWIALCIPNTNSPSTAFPPIFFASAPVAPTAFSHSASPSFRYRHSRKPSNTLEQPLRSSRWFLVPCRIPSK